MSEKRIKHGGRTKGTPNKTPGKIREKFQGLIEENLERLSRDIENLDPQQRLKVIIDLSRFVLPTLKATSLSSTGGSITIIVESTDAQLGS